MSTYILDDIRPIFIRIPEIDRIIFPFFFFIFRHVAQGLIGKFSFDERIIQIDKRVLRLHHLQENSKGFKTKSRSLKSRNPVPRTNLEGIRMKKTEYTHSVFCLNSLMRNRLDVWRARLNASRANPLLEIWKARGIFRPRVNVSFVPLVTGARVQRPSWALF